MPISVTPRHSIMGIVAKRDGIDLAGTTIAIEKHMTPEPPRRIERVVVAFTMPKGVPVEQRPKLERAAHTCPVILSLHPDIRKSVSFTWLE